MENNKDFFYLDLSDEQIWLIKSKGGQRYTAGFRFKENGIEDIEHKNNVKNLIKRLNEAHRPNIEQIGLNKISVCWNYHEKGEKYNFISEIRLT